MVVFEVVSSVYRDGEFETAASLLDIRSRRFPTHLLEPFNVTAQDPRSIRSVYPRFES